ncbi:MAG: alpha-amylase family glycosyl hydrolase [Phycisphaerae bacterium]
MIVHILTALMALMSLATATPPAAQARPRQPQSEEKGAKAQRQTELRPDGSTTKRDKAAAVPAPAWTRDARWYQIVVRSFRNGDATNDPPECLPWSANRSARSRSAPPVDPEGTGAKIHTPNHPDSASKDRGTPEHGVPPGAPAASDGGADVDVAVSGTGALEYGGDLQGLQAKLPYLTKLGVNVVYLMSVFRAGAPGTRDGVDMRHIDDSLGKAGSFAQLTGETDDPKTWRFSASDRVFLAFVREAHKANIRVVLEGPFDSLIPPIGASKNLESSIFAVTMRWMDPDGDGRPSDGIDGWVVHAAGEFWRRMGRNWRIHVRRTSPHAVVAGDLRESPLGSAAAEDFDLVIGYDLGATVQRFFSQGTNAYPVQQFLDDLARQRKDYGALGSAPGNGIILPLGGPRMGRMLSGLAQGRRRPSEADSARWRLATVFQHFYQAAPMTYYGDEVAMPGDGPGAYAPMWWNDLSDPSCRSPDYRGDFLALVRMLNALREQYASLRYGTFHPVLLDQGRRVLAFRRSLGSEEAIIVMNYGDNDRRVKLPAHRPGQLVRVINPQLAPKPTRKRSAASPADHTQIARLRVAGTRQFADNLGEMSLWVAPMSVRIALIKRDE